MTFRRRLTVMGVLAAGLAAVGLFALLAGEYDISPEQVWSLLWGKITGAGFEGVGRAREIIIWRIRLPRLILALSSGAALAVSGAAYQSCFRNPLVEPYILGVSSGAACGAALSIVFPGIFPQGQLTAFAFALGAVFVSCALARSRGQTPAVTLILSGVIVGALFSAVVGVMKYLAADAQLREITFWMMGGLYYATWDDAKLGFMTALPVFLLLWRFGWRLNVLSLGDEEASSLGLNPARSRLIVIVAATLASSVCVSICGIIAWVGLMTPHAARLIFGSDNRWVMPGAALLGATYLLACDTLARTLTTAEIPLGIITSIAGAPYLLWLLRAKGRSLHGL